MPEPALPAPPRVGSPQTLERLREACARAGFDERSARELAAVPEDLPSGRDVGFAGLEVLDHLVREHPQPHQHRQRGSRRSAPAPAAS